jgi:predicted membrane protein
MSERVQPRDPRRHRRDETGSGRRGGGGGLVFGFLLLVAGVLFLFDNIGMADIEPYYEWWPLALIAIGIGELFGGSRSGAAIWLAIGGWFLLNNFEVIDANPFEILWPALWIAVGGILVWQSLTQPRIVPGGERMSALAVMAGNVQRAAGASVRSVQATAVMGGCEIDLRKMAPGERETVVDLFAMWGGIEIQIPEGWALINHVTPILAAVEDKTAPAAPDAPRVVLRGTLVMGGVEVRN